MHPFSATDPDETETTFLGNARIKAIAYAKATGRITIAEDSGLSIAALNGLPGVYSARFTEAVFEKEEDLLIVCIGPARPREVAGGRGIVVMAFKRI